MSGCGMRLVLALDLFAIPLVAGCAATDNREPAQTGTPRQSPATPPADDVIRRIEADPPGFLREVYGRSDALTQYRLTFYRQERLGLIPRLTPLERIQASFRKNPFSVRFEWPDADADYAESIYVAGRNNNKLIVRERKGLLGLPPTTRIVDVQDPVKFGRSRNPITDFGLARVAKRTIDSLNDPQMRKSTKITYEGIVQLQPIDRPAYAFRIDRSTVPGTRYPRQDFFVDVHTLLPAGTDLYLPDGALDTRYRYTDVNVDVNLTGADFQLAR